MNTQIKNNNQVILNLISWCVSIIPITLIFSNAISDIIVVTASLFFIFISIKKNNWGWLNESWIKIGLLIYFWLIVTSFFAYDIELALSRSTAWIRFIIFAASLQFIFLSKKKLKNRLVFCTFLALVYVNIEMFIEYFTGSSLYSKIRFNFLDDVLFNGGMYRISGPFKDSPKSGIYLAYFLFPAIFALIEIIKNKFSKFSLSIFVLLILSVNLYLVYLSGHRASMLSVLISLSIICLYIFLKRKKVAIFLLVFTISSIFFIYKSNFFNDDKQKVKNLINKTHLELVNYSKSGYGSLSLTSFKMFKSNPIFGIGLKNFRVACERDEFLSKGHMGTGYGVSPWKGHYNQELKSFYAATCSSHPHNLYLTWLAETGFIGFTLFTLFIFAIIKKLFKYREITDSKIVVLAILISLIPKLVPMMPSLNFFSNWNAICFWLLIGWLLSFYTKKKDSLLRSN